MQNAKVKKEESGNLGREFKRKCIVGEFLPDCYPHLLKNLDLDLDLNLNLSSEKQD